MSFANFPFEFFFQCHMGHSHFSLSTVGIDSRPRENAMFEETWTKTIRTRAEVPLHWDKIPVYDHQGSENKMPFSQPRTICRDQGSSPPFKVLCWLQLKAEGKEHNSNVPMGQPDWVWSTQCIPLCCSLVLKLYFINTEDTPPSPCLQLAHLGAKSKNELFTSSETSKRASWTCSFKTQPLLRRHNTLEWTAESSWQRTFSVIVEAANHELISFPNWRERIFPAWFRGNARIPWFSSSLQGSSHSPV